MGGAVDETWVAGVTLLELHEIILKRVVRVDGRRIPMRVSGETAVEHVEPVLRLEEIRRHKSPRGSELAFLKAPGSQEEIEITYFPNGGPVQVQPDLTHLAFLVDSLDEFSKHLVKLGIKYSDGPTTSSTGTKFAFIDAPEGYEIELIEKGKGIY